MEWVKDNIFVKDTDIEIKDFKLILIKGGVHLDRYYGIVGLGNSYYKNGNDSDFLMMIKEKGYIKEQLITFGKSMLKLGERDEIHNDIKKKECRTRDKRYKNPQYFFCIVDAILLYANDKIYSDDISEQIRFSFEEYDIHCPEHFFNTIIENIFKPFIASNKCKEEKAKANFLDTVIYCEEEEAIQLLSHFDIYFFIGKWNIHFSFSELFRNKKFLIVHNQSNDRWVFGLIIGSKYSVTIDKESKVISFNPLYSN